jgi:hypothetical protein
MDNPIWLVPTTSPPFKLVRWSPSSVEMFPSLYIEVVLFFTQSEVAQSMSRHRKSYRVCARRKIKSEISPSRWSKTCVCCREKSPVRETPSYGWYMLLHKLNMYRCFYWRADDAQIPLIAASADTANWVPSICFRLIPNSRYVGL